ncbi:MAG: squalene--hopene cyclase [Chloroflexi bacterium]|nr:squalene--hopene cyclase [Chloroflexota bacterium]
MSEVETTTASGVAGDSLHEALDEAIRRAQRYLLSIQYPEGFWWGELESNVAITAEYLLLTHFLGVADADRWHLIVKYLKSKQLPSGAWNIYYDGPDDLNATVESYFALKLAGVSPDEPFMRKARQFVLSRGGVPKVRIFTKIWLSLFGQWDWKGTPMMPPEIMFLPNWFPFNIYEFSSWARATVVAMLILLTKKPVRDIPEWARIDELYCQPRDQVDYSMPRPKSILGWKGFFHMADKLLRIYDRVPLKPGREAAIRKAERWIVEHQEADGSWGGIQPPWVYALMALNSLGYSMDHPVMKKGFQGFEGFAIDDETGFRTQSCLSPVWDTALAMIALVDSGLPPDHPALVKAGEWLLKEQIFVGGDWQVKNPHAEPGGWAFEFDNDIYPDVDDAAEVLIALLKTKLPDDEAKRRAMEKGLRWTLSMQSKNGGWGSFDVDNTKRFITKIPFADFGETIDPPSEDVTAHIIEYMGKIGYRADDSIVRRALAYLKREQQYDGCWWGRWGVNFTYGTGAVLPALKEVGEDMRQPYVRAAVRWLEEHQHPNGGWGESCHTYDDPSTRGQGATTASQTAWALMALLAAGEEASPVVERGIRYLVETQLPDGSWDEPYFTGTGFPRDFLINYHLYRDIFPLTALGRYKAYLDSRR